eukprot:symbB.v1.2.034638.t1/scaffold4472.1/size40791/2
MCGESCSHKDHSFAHNAFTMVIQHILRERLQVSHLFGQAVNFAADRQDFEPASLGLKPCKEDSAAYKILAFTGLHKDPLQCPWAAGCDVFFGQHVQTVSTMALLESSAYTSHAQLVAQLHRLCPGALGIISWSLGFDLAAT